MGDGKSCSNCKKFKSSSNYHWTGKCNTWLHSTYAAKFDEFYCSQHEFEDKNVELLYKPELPDNIPLGKFRLTMEDIVENLNQINAFIKARDWK